MAKNAGPANDLMTVSPSAQLMEAYYKLLLAFHALPRTERSRTFMEVSGYPHYENVASNILAFFFDPGAEHGLNDLLIAAFLQLAGHKMPPAVGKISIKRERGTDDRKRLDLLIDSETFTIGIETKIFHRLGNDLAGYASVIDQRGHGKQIIVKAVLGLRHVQSVTPLPGGFQSLTFSQLWQQVRAVLGHHVTNANPRWVTFLIDFMETTNNLAGQNKSREDADRFFIEHDELIEKMIGERDAFLGRLGQRVSALCEMMQEVSECPPLARKPWVYENSGLVLDYRIDDKYSVAFDLYLRPAGWELQLFGRTRDMAKKYVQELIEEPALSDLASKAPIVDDRHIVATWPLITDLVVIKEALVKWMAALQEAIRTAAARQVRQ